MLVREMADLQIRVAVMWVVTLGSVALVLLTAYGVVRWENVDYLPLFGNQQYSDIIFGGAAIVCSLYLLHNVWGTRIGPLERILWELIYIAIELDRWNAQQYSVARQLLLIERLDACAALIEQYPLAFGLRREDDSATAISTSCVGIANQFREYKTWIAMPIATTSADLVERVSEAIHFIVRGSWHFLPRSEAVINRRANWLHRLGWAIVAILLVGVIVFIALRQADFGTTGSILSSIVALVIVFVLNRLGIKISMLQQASDVASRIGSVK